VNTKELLAAAKQPRNLLTRYVRDSLVSQPTKFNARVIDWPSDAPAQVVASKKILNKKRKAQDVAQARKAALYALAALAKVPAVGSGAAAEFERVENPLDRIMLLSVISTNPENPKEIDPLETLDKKLWLTAMEWAVAYMAAAGWDPAEAHKTARSLANSPHLFRI